MKRVTGSKRVIRSRQTKGMARWQAMSIHYCSKHKQSPHHNARFRSLSRCQVQQVCIVMER